MQDYFNSTERHIRNQHVCAMTSCFYNEAFFVLYKLKQAVQKKPVTLTNYRLVILILFLRIVDMCVLWSPSFGVCCLTYAPK